MQPVNARAQNLFIAYTHLYYHRSIDQEISVVKCFNTVSHTKVCVCTNKVTMAPLCNFSTHTDVLTAINQTPPTSILVKNRLLPLQVKTAPTIRTRQENQTDVVITVILIGTGMHVFTVTLD